MYIYRRSQQLVDALIGDHFWLKVVVNDTGTSAGTYALTVLDSTFLVDDPVAGSDQSAAIAASFIAALNASAEPVTAMAGANTNEVLIRFNNFGQIPEDTYNQKYGYSASTTDAEGSITAAAVHPTSYDVQTATNWDGVFASMKIVPFRQGALSDRFRPSRMVAANSVNAHQLKNRTRFLFSPNDYTLDDSDVLFFTIVENVDGVTFTRPINILLTAQQYLDQRAPLILTGTAPTGATQEDALRLPLPRQMSSIVVTNTGATNPLYISFGVGAAEITLGIGETFRDNRLNTSVITVRGNTLCEIYAVMAVNSQL